MAPDTIFALIFAAIGWSAAFAMNRIADNYHGMFIEQYRARYGETPDQTGERWARERKG